MIFVRLDRERVLDKEFTDFFIELGIIQKP